MTKLLKNLIKGAGSVIDIAPNRASRDATTGRFYTTHSDVRSISRDWVKVGRDIRVAANAAMKDHDKTAE